jgi:hypothetical protein
MLYVVASTCHIKVAPLRLLCASTRPRLLLHVVLQLPEGRLSLLQVLLLV